MTIDDIEEQATPHKGWKTNVERMIELSRKQGIDNL